LWTAGQWASEGGLKRMKEYRDKQTERMREAESAEAKPPPAPKRKGGGGTAGKPAKKTKADSGGGEKE